MMTVKAPCAVHSVPAVTFFILAAVNTKKEFKILCSAAEISV